MTHTGSFCPMDEQERQNPVELRSAARQRDRLVSPAAAERYYPVDKARETRRMSRPTKPRNAKGVMAERWRTWAAETPTRKRNPLLIKARPDAGTAWIWL